MFSIWLTCFGKVKAYIFVDFAGRQKGHLGKRNSSLGNVMLLIDENAPRCHWLMGHVKDVKVNSDGLVQTVTLRCGINL